jgi:Raf kinase inhibitor-like YbhB/YbcL family protein
VRVATTLLAGGLLLAACGGDEPATPPASSAVAELRVTSAAFADGATIPPEFTCAGDGRSPDVRWAGVPADAASVALVVTDPDAPSGTFVHWRVYGLPPSDGAVAAGERPSGASEGDNSGGGSGWTAPCPPSGTHHYVFTVYALRDQVSGGSTQERLDGIGRATLARGLLTGVVAAD